MYTLAKGNTFKHKRAIVEEIHKQKAEYVFLRDVKADLVGRNEVNFFKIRWRLDVSNPRLLVRDDRTGSSRKEMRLEGTKLLLPKRRSRCILLGVCFCVLEICFTA